MCVCIYQYVIFFITFKKIFEDAINVINFVFKEASS